MNQEFGVRGIVGAEGDQVPEGDAGLDVVRVLWVDHVQLEQKLNGRQSILGTRKCHNIIKQSYEAGLRVSTWISGKVFHNSD